MRDTLSDLRPREFGVALVMAATWYFFGPWGIIPTIWFLSLIVETPPPWISLGARLLPVAQRRAIAASSAKLQAQWEQITAPWREDDANDLLSLPSATQESSTQRISDAGTESADLGSIEIRTLAESDNLLIVGNRGSGKTTLLQAILRERQRRCYILDPHNHPGKWPSTARVIGGGRDFPAIYSAIQRGTAELTRRAQILNTNAEARFTPITLASDEWGSITSEVSVSKYEEAPGRLILRLLKEGRKFGLSFIACAHGDSAASLGSKGDTVAFQASFDWIIYCGAFVGRHLSDHPDLVRQLPQGRTPEGGSFPLIVVAISPTTGERKLLDMRGLATAKPVQKKRSQAKAARAAQPSPAREERQPNQRQNSPQMYEVSKGSALASTSTANNPRLHPGC